MMSVRFMSCRCIRNLSYFNFSLNENCSLELTFTLLYGQFEVHGPMVNADLRLRKKWHVSGASCEHLPSVQKHRMPSYGGAVLIGTFGDAVPGWFSVATMRI